MEHQPWSWRGDLVAKSTASGAYAPVPLTDASGDLVSSVSETYDWNEAWGYRNESFSAGLQKVGVRLMFSTRTEGMHVPPSDPAS